MPPDLRAPAAPAPTAPTAPASPAPARAPAAIAPPGPAAAAGTGAHRLAPAERRTLAWAILAHTLAWTLAQWLASGNLDGYFDMLENVGWAQTFEWGTFKHPPLFAWVTGAWFALMPHTDWSYFLLAYVNVGVGLAGVAALACQAGLARLALPAVLLLAWTLPQTTLASKFNANAQLLSLWPWTVAALYATLRRPGRAGWGGAAALGVLAAAGLLAKYFSAVFLLGLLAGVACRPEGRRWLASPALAVALAAFIATLAPHVAWLIRLDFPTVRYAMDQGGGVLDWFHLGKFALSPLIYWLPGWLVVVTLAARGAAQAGQLPSAWRAWPGLALRSWLPQRPAPAAAAGPGGSRWGDLLAWVALAPLAVTLLCGAAELAELSIPWAIPLGFAYSLLWLRNLQPWLGADRLDSLPRAHAVVLALAAVLVGPGVAAWRASQGDSAYYRPDAAAAQAVLQGWQARHPALPAGSVPGWVGGDWAHDVVLPFYADARIRALPGLPDGRDAAVAPLAGWQRLPGLLLCPLGELGPAGAPPPATPAAAQQAQAQTRAATDTCVREAQAWLRARGDADTVHPLVAAKPASWRFPQPRAWGYAVMDVPAR